MAEVGVCDMVVFVAVLDVGEETFLDALEGTKVFLEAGHWLAGAEGLENAVLDEAENGFEVGLAVGLLSDLNGGRVLAESFDGDGFGVVAGEEFAEGTLAGGQGEAAFLARAGEFLDDESIGKLGAEVDDELLVFLRETGEHVECFHKRSDKL